MRVLLASVFTCAALALLSTGCGESAKQAPDIAGPDEVVLSVPGMS